MEQMTQPTSCSVQEQTILRQLTVPSTIASQPSAERRIVVIHDLDVPSNPPTFENWEQERIRRLAEAQRLKAERQAKRRLRKEPQRRLRKARREAKFFKIRLKNSVNQSGAMRQRNSMTHNGSQRRVAGNDSSTPPSPPSPPTTSATPEAANWADRDLQPESRLDSQTPSDYPVSRELSHTDRKWATTDVLLPTATSKIRQSADSQNGITGIGRP